MISLNQLTKVYPQTGAGLGPIDAKIGEGEWVTLLGPSGSGKSTLLKLISGLEEPSFGSFSHSYAPSEIGYVFQEAALLPWKTVLENVTLPLDLKGAKSSDSLRLARPWIQKLHLENFEHAYPHELSGGLKMRVSIARALITQPKLLLLDEPFAALDEPIRIELGLELRALWRSLHPTVVMVTHSITEGLWLADRVLILQGQPGEVVLDMPTQLGEDRPLSIRGSPGFLDKVEQCFGLLKGQDQRPVSRSAQP